MSEAGSDEAKDSTRSLVRKFSMTSEKAFLPVKLLYTVDSVKYRKKDQPRSEEHRRRKGPERDQNQRGL